MDAAVERSRPVRRLWTFGRCSFDEARWALVVDGREVELEPRPLEILLELLRHAGEVVTKDELLDSVWPGVLVLEGSLTTAVSKLRKAMNDPGGAIIATVPRIGYRMAVAVASRVIEAAAAQALPFEPGMAVEGKPNWRFAERLSLSHASEVWRIDHAKTGERHVVKYAADANRLRSLKREVAISRLLKQAFGERPDFVYVLDWNFATPPYWAESAYGGPTMSQWADAQGGLAAVDMAVRLDMLASVCATVAVAHGVAVLHGDLKPRQRPRRRRPRRRAAAKGGRFRQRRPVRPRPHGRLRHHPQRLLPGPGRRGASRPRAPRSGWRRNSWPAAPPASPGTSSPWASCSTRSWSATSAGRSRPGGRRRSQTPCCARTSPWRRPAIRRGGWPGRASWRRGCARWTRGGASTTPWPRPPSAPGRPSSGWNACVYAAPGSPRR